MVVGRSHDHDGINRRVLTCPKCNFTTDSGFLYLEHRDRCIVTNRSSMLSSDPNIIDPGHEMFETVDQNSVNRSHIRGARKIGKNLRSNVYKLFGLSNIITGSLYNPEGFQELDRNWNVKSSDEALEPSEDESDPQVQFDRVSQSEEESDFNNKDHITIKFRCELCEAEFTDEEDYMDHYVEEISLMERTNQQPELSQQQMTNYFFEQLDVEATCECKMCGKVFEEEDMLNRHMRRFHVAEDLPYSVCAICFDRSGITTYYHSDPDLRAHIIENHPEELKNCRFVCAVCPFETLLKTNLRQHYATEHGEIEE